jgi:hypothetical protein
MPRNRQSTRPSVTQMRADGDTQAARIDRLISSMRAGESACTVLVKSALSLTSSTTGATSVVWTYPEIAAADDFVSLAQQFNMFKVKCMRFNFCHVNPTSTAAIVASTVHSNTSGAIPTTWTSEQSVIDGPDSIYLSPGGEQETLYWNGSGVSETEFQDCTSYNNHGGLRVYLPQVSVVNQTAVVVCSAVVIFKGRR